MVFVIVLDLSQPDTCVATLVDWLQRVHSYTKGYHDSAAPTQSAASKQALLQYVKTARIKKGKAAKDAEEAEPALEALSSEDLFIQDHFAVPILVVGNKADTVVADTSAAMKQARELQGRIRSICLEVGAALVYTSTTPTASTSTGAGNTAVLKSYMMHRLYPDQISMELSLEVKTSYFLHLRLSRVELCEHFGYASSLLVTVLHCTLRFTCRTSWRPASCRPASTLPS
jgi:hypothetical protein